MDISPELLEELECPVCLERFQPPIAICVNGHSVCGRCKTQISTCPVCRAMFLDTRNRTLEKVIQVVHKVTLRCKFHIIGCNFTSLVDDVSEHEMICSRRPYKCPVADCAWNSPLDDVKRHMTTKHKIRLHAQAQGGVKSLYKYGSYVWHKGITYSDELFVHVSKVESEMLYTCVLHIGLKNETSKFRYTAKIRGRNNNEHVLVDHAVRNYAEGFDQIVSSGGCVSLSPDITQRLLGQRKLKLLGITVKIHVAQG